MGEELLMNKRYESIAWGVILILFGSLCLIPGDQTDIFVLGIGLILLGLNLARLVSHVPVNGFSLTLGSVALVFGTLALLRPIFGWGLHIELTIIPVLFVAIGLYLLAFGSKRVETR